MTATALQRLLQHVHAAVFDKKPASELALRIRHPLGATWIIADEVLAVRAGAGAALSFNLADYTVGSLAAALVLAGFEVPLVAPGWAGRSAMVLVEGSGDQYATNGDHVSSFTSLLWVLMSGYAGEVREAEYQMGQALRQMIITQAEGEWLDVWGTLYGDARKPGEQDASYAPRIPQEAFRIRVNALAIEKAIFDQTGFDVRIEEPWADIFTLDQSLLSGPDKLYDGEFSGYHLIRPTSRQEVDWAVVNAIIDRNRPAGVLRLQPLVRRIRIIDASQGHGVVGGGHSQLSHRVIYEDRALLDMSLVLDDNSVNVKNYSARHGREIRRFSHVIVASQAWTAPSWGSGDWNQTYLVTGDHSRDYRVYFGHVVYQENWSHRTSWAQADGTWSDIDPVVSGALTRIPL